MRKRGMPAVHGNEVNVTPLIDVVMCLIIFFMLVAKIGITNGAEEIKIPESYLGVTIKEMGNTLLLNVHLPDDATSRYPLVRALVKGELKDLPFEVRHPDGSPVMIGGPGGRPIAESPLLLAMQDMKKINPDFQVIIRADQALPYKYLIQVLMKCNEAGVKIINFDTKTAPRQAVQ